MNITKHCQLCDHQRIDFKTGTICKLTDRKPDFVNKCIAAKFDSKLKTKIEETNVQYQDLLKTKWLIYANFILFFTIAITVILAGYFGAQYLLQFAAIGALPIVVSLIGLVYILPMAIGPLNTY
ncbi:hypothetical protein [Winogradskyella forsetii]|uniref:hypothetical protein n=1 Tax=Winogradskyella forsetii TaxID=2686077 RepID=UPI0015B82A56|nr:hypothetical protein [Winogradskyella forsetii]